jgi:putative transposase
MAHMYQMAGISKQAHYKRLYRQGQLKELTCDILQQAQDLRMEHPRMGCWKLYFEWQHQSFGRDKTELLLLSEGFRPKTFPFHCEPSPCHPERSEGSTPWMQ